MKLNKQQYDAVQVLNWLLDDSDESRQTGRTIALAVAYITKAWKNPGKKVYFRDHVEYIQCDARLGRTIEEIIINDKKLAKLNWRFCRDHFICGIDGIPFGKITQISGVPAEMEK